MCNKKVKSSEAGWLGLIWMYSAHCDKRLFRGTAVARIEGSQCLGLCVNLPPSCSSTLYSRTWLPLIRPCYQLGSCNKATRKALGEAKTYHCCYRKKKPQPSSSSSCWKMETISAGPPLNYFWFILMQWRRWFHCKLWKRGKLCHVSSRNMWMKVKTTKYQFKEALCHHPNLNLCFMIPQVARVSSPSLRMWRWWRGAQPTWPVAWITMITLPSSGQTLHNKLCFLETRKVRTVIYPNKVNPNEIRCVRQVVFH